MSAKDLCLGKEQCKKRGGKNAPLFALVTSVYFRLEYLAYSILSFQLPYRLHIHLYPL